MTHLVEIFLPLPGDHKKLFAKLCADLTKYFGGVTAFMRAPAKGAFVDHNKTINDDIVILEIMTDELNRQWWRRLKKKLEKQFEQKEILIRASSVERI